VWGLPLYRQQLEIPTVTDHRPGHHNTVKRQARVYQSSHPGTPYAAALAAVRQSPPAAAPQPERWLPIGQGAAEHPLGAIVDRHHRDAAAGNPKPVRLIFTGPPGSGKATAAKLMLRRLGLPGRRVIRLDAARFDPLVDEASDTVAKVDDDGILYIANCAEARTAEQGGNVALWSTLLYCLAEHPAGRRKGVILAGQPHVTAPHYWRDLGEAMAQQAERVTAAIQQWIATEFLDPPIVFHTMSATHLADVASAHAKREGYTLAADAVQEFATTISALPPRILDDYGNARFARRTVADAIECQALRLLPKVAALAELSDSELTTITGADVRASLDWLHRNTWFQERGRPISSGHPPRSGSTRNTKPAAPPPWA
jgi:hypothetical protein